MTANIYQHGQNGVRPTRVGKAVFVRSLLLLLALILLGSSFLYPAQAQDIAPNLDIDFRLPPVEEESESESARAQGPPNNGIKPTVIAPPPPPPMRTRRRVRVFGAYDSSVSDILGADILDDAVISQTTALVATEASSRWSDMSLTPLDWVITVVWVIWVGLILVILRWSWHSGYLRMRLKRGLVLAGPQERAEDSGDLSGFDRADRAAAIRQKKLAKLQSHLRESPSRSVENQYQPSVAPRPRDGPAPKDADTKTVNRIVDEIFPEPTISTEAMAPAPLASLLSGLPLFAPPPDPTAEMPAIPPEKSTVVVQRVGKTTRKPIERTYQPTKGRAHVTMTLDVITMAMTEQELKVSFGLYLANKGDRAAGDVMIRLDLQQAQSQQEQIVGNFFDGQGGAVLREAMTLAAGSLSLIQGDVAIRLDECPEVTLESHRVVVPIMALDVGYQWQNGDVGNTGEKTEQTGAARKNGEQREMASGQVASAFLLGEEWASGHDKPLRPLRLDRAPCTIVYSGVRATTMMRKA